MTMVDTPLGTGDAEADPVLAADLDDLRRALGDHPFPATQDDLIAALLSRHEPARLACRLSVLSREHSYAALEDVLADVAAAAVRARLP